MIHISHEDSFVTDDDDFYIPRCICGWQFAPVPDVDLVCDALMDHARERALFEHLSAGVGGADRKAPQ